MRRQAPAPLVLLLLACPSSGGTDPSSTSSTGEDDDSSTAATIDPTPATLDGDSSTNPSTTTDTTTASSSDGDTSGVDDSESSTSDGTSSASESSSTSTSGGPVCGDDDQDGDEACDGRDLAGYTCVSLGPNFTGGTLACDDACDFDISDCNDDEPMSYDIGFCRLQFPDAVETNVGAQVDVFGRVYIEGLTDLSQMNDLAVNVSGWVGVGPDGSDPVIDAGWTWTQGVPNGSYGPASPGAEDNNDEYQAVMTAPAAGSYDFAFRFSGDGGDTFVYCDGQPAGNSDGYQPDNAGQLTTEN